MSPALRYQEPEACEELDEALVADFAAGAGRGLFQFDAALAAARADAAAVVELVRVLQGLAGGLALHGFHELGRRSRALEERVLRAAGGPTRALLAELGDFRASMAEAFAEARRQVEPDPQGPAGWFAPPARTAAGWRQRRLVIAVLEGNPTLTGAAAGTALARAATHLVCTGGAAAQAYRESCGDGVILRIGEGSARGDQFSDLFLPGAGQRGALLAASCDAAVLTSSDDQALCDARALLAAGKPVAQVMGPAAVGGFGEPAGCRLLFGADAARAVVAVLVELSRG